MTDEIRVTIAAQACMLLLHRSTRYFPGLSSIIVYPGECVADYRTVDESGVVTEWSEIISGESSERGTLVLSWEDVIAGCAEPREGCNVVIHEFAHQLDTEDGITNGVPLIHGDRDRLEWAEVFRREFTQLRDETRQGLKTLLDPYGAEEPAEFFAVAVECFFGRPRAMKTRHPALYDVMRRYFRQDPAEFIEEPENRRKGNSLRRVPDSH